MWDLAALVVLFLVLVGTLAVVQYLPGLFRSSGDPAKAQALLEDWLQAHNVELPSVAGVIALINKQLEKERDSEDIDHIRVSGLLPKTELPKFSIHKADLSTDNTDIILSCVAEWPMCLPGVRVEVRERGSQDTAVCHFAIDWMTAKMEITLSDCDGDVLLSYKNTQPFRMGVACMVKEGNPKNHDRMASQVADILQVTLMGLSLDKVSVAVKENHTPSTPPIPQLLVSSVEEGSLSNGYPDDRHEPASVCDSRPSNGVIREMKMEDLQEREEEVKEKIEVVKEEEEEEEKEEVKEMVRPDIEAVVESHENSVEDVSSSTIEDRRNDDFDRTSSSSSIPSLPSPLVTPRSMPGGGGSAAESNHYPDIPEDSELPPTPQDLPGNGLVRVSSIEVTSPSPDSAQLHSPRWRRTPSYEQLEEIGLDDVPGSNLKQHRSNSTDRLASPTKLSFASSPSGKNSLTLSMAGSEVESVYGADDRIPSVLVFEIEEVGGRVRHIVASSTPHAIKLRQRYKTAKKLHIYNDHVFIASKIKSKLECAVCKERLSKLFGKTGYMCRCCNTVVHKQCHWKVEEVCRSSTVSSMNLVYLEEKDT